MVCYPTPTYIAARAGVNLVISQGDGYTVAISWDQAYPSSPNFQIGYNIYYSTLISDVIKEGVKQVSWESNIYTADILDLTPGDTYYFQVRAFQYEPNLINLALLPDGLPGLKVYPESILLANLGVNDTSMTISDIDLWPSSGILQIGYELIRYTSKDVPANQLLNLSRGYLGSVQRFHQTDGYDGDLNHDPILRFWKGYEEDNNVVAASFNKFHDNKFAWTATDGYKSIDKDNLTTDLSGSDAANEDFPSLPLIGYRRLSPVDLLSGKCIGSYAFRQYLCADGYNVGPSIASVSLQDANNQREELLFTLTAELVVLVKRLWTGIICPCYEPTNEQPQNRCPRCYGTGFLTGYEQYFNPRRSDGRILVRFGPSVDDLQLDEPGLESVHQPDCETLVVPTVKDRDFLIRFTEDGQREFRYEILNVTRNKLLFGQSGGQKFSVTRVRKTDPIYSWRAIDDTSTIPSTISTTIGMVSGPGGIPPHTHNIVISEKITALSQINQTTSVAQGHNHSVILGVVQESVGHSHTIMLP
jgi:hypothetical protein